MKTADKRIKQAIMWPILQHRRVFALGPGVQGGLLQETRKMLDKHHGSPSSLLPGQEGDAIVWPGKVSSMFKSI